MSELADRLVGVLGDRTATALAKGLGLRTVADLVHHYPRRYADRGELTDLRDVALGEHVTVMAEVVSATSRRMTNRRGTMLTAAVSDGRARLSLVFFNQPWRERELVPGRRGLFSGKVSAFGQTLQLTQPDYLLLDGGASGGSGAGDDQASAEAAQFVEALVPVYPATSNMASWRISQAVRIVLDQLDVVDPVPDVVLAERGLVDLASALNGIHRPADRAQLRQAEDRLRFDEAFVPQVWLAQRRLRSARLRAVPRPGRPDGLLAAFDAQTPFTLTAGQRQVGEVIAGELAGTAPMHRLLEGEVGSGKTLVALRAMLAVVDSGGQAALLAPTEVLAAQHERSLTSMLGPLAMAGQLGSPEVATRVVLLTGSLSADARRRALLDIQSGAAGIVVGTHALLQDKVGFAELGLVVVDEQHRFGVEQRDALRTRSAEPPHLLVMTATPIPRTVAMTVYGDLETSSLTELPAGRQPIATHVVPAQRPDWVARMWERIRTEVEQGHQAFVVCPRIGGDEPADDPDLRDPELEDEPEPQPGAGPGAVPRRQESACVLDVHAELASGPLAGLRVAALHGRLPAEEKDAVMRAFAAGDLDVLIATTVVEVGVDVPNATVMAVLDAEWFGVSQLHQLRGRIGRGTAPGTCLLRTWADPETPAGQRLAAVAATQDGPTLARLDLRQRGEGDVLSAAQSGRSSLRFLRLLDHEDLILDARAAATATVQGDPDLTQWPALAAQVAALEERRDVDFLEKA